MKIALLTHEFYPILSGGTIFTEKLAIEFSARGHQVEVLTSGIGKDFAREEKHAAYRVRRFFCRRQTNHDATLLEHLFFVLLAGPQVLLYLRKQRFDLVFSVFAIPSGFLATLAQGIFGIPHVVFVDAADLPGVESRVAGAVRYLSAFVRWVTNHARGVTVCEGLEDIARPLTNNPNFVAIPNGTILPNAQALPGNDRKTLNILSIGRLVPRKGFIEIAEALALLRKRHENFKLTIIGYGTNEEEIRKVIEDFDVGDKIQLLGRVEYQKLQEYYLAADLYLFYGGREGSSLAMVEAVSYGLPIIASDHPGNRSYVKEGHNGFLVEHRNPKVLASALEKFLVNPELLKSMGEKSRLIANDYSWPQIAGRYLEFFDQCVPELSEPDSPTSEERRLTRPGL